MEGMVCRKGISSFSLGKPFDKPSPPSPMLNPSNILLNDAHQWFHKKMDQLTDMHVCSICKECYPGIVTKNFHGSYACSRCILEWKFHCSSLENNMDLGNWPVVLAVLTQVEEMIISRANPILQVTHAHGGQYKYSGHTILLPPRHFQSCHIPTAFSVRNPYPHCPEIQFYKQSIWTVC